MPVYLTIVDAEPQADSDFFGQFAGACVHVYVRAHSPEEADRKAAECLTSHRWRVLDEQLTARNAEAQLPDLGTAESAAYRRAERDGVYSLVFAWPPSEKVPRLH